jgi:hypothetical protein
VREEGADDESAQAPLQSFAQVEERTETRNARGSATDENSRANGAHCEHEIENETRIDGMKRLATTPTW